jgi:hypothetical protein
VKSFYILYEIVYKPTQFREQKEKRKVMNGGVGTGPRRKGGCGGWPPIEGEKEKK